MLSLGPDLVDPEKQVRARVCEVEERVRAVEAGWLRGGGSGEECERASRGL